MRHDYTLTDYGVTLRPVEKSDTEFIITLRTRPEVRNYIGDTGDAAAQCDWMERYFQRPGDWYFIVAREGDLTPEGTIALYNVEEHHRAEWGRWAMQPGSRLGPAGAALIYRFGFEVLKLESLCSRTVAENRRAVAFHDVCGLYRTGVERSAVVIGGRAYDLVVHEASRSDWPRLKRVLDRSARLAF